MGSARVGSNPILVEYFFTDAKNTFLSDFDMSMVGKVKKSDSVTGNRTRACWVRASYPNH